MGLQRLVKGQEYQFRVIAINKAGRSEPSVASRPKMAKEADLLPYIDAKTLRDVKMDAKDRLKFDVPIFGEPAPVATTSLRMTRVYQSPTWRATPRLSSTPSLRSTRAPTDSSSGTNLARTPPSSP